MRVSLLERGRGRRVTNVFFGDLNVLSANHPGDSIAILRMKIRFGDLRLNVLGVLLTGSIVALEVRHCTDEVKNG
jgi:hypothetical protein